MLLRSIFTSGDSTQAREVTTVGLFSSGFTLFSVMSTHYFNKKRIFFLFFFRKEGKKARVREGRERKGKERGRKEEGR